MHSITKNFAIVALLLNAPFAFAQENPDISIHGTIQVKMPVPNHGKMLANQKPAERIFTLQKIQISKRMREHLAQQLEANMHTPITMQGRTTKTTMQLGMNGVPVLDQGQHGTCATFAVTAGLDAFLKNKPEHDYISQLCNLELGATLAQENPDYPSGWEGSNGSIILKQISDYGIITKSFQHENGCAGHFEYDDSEGEPMAKEEFLAHHELIMPTIPYTKLFDIEEMPNRSRNEAKQIMNQVRNALTQEHRVVFGTIIPMFIDGTIMGTNAKYHVQQDSWTLTQSLIDLMRNDNAPLGGHEMVITGFDDKAVMVDVYGKKHTGVLSIRNSWGNQYGDKGDFYISYDFFTVMALEAYEIG